MTNKMGNAVLPPSLLFGWGVGSLGTGTLLNAITFLVLFYMASVLGIEPALAGALIFASKVYDMFTDPLMGWISDRTRSRIGRRRPYLLLGAVLCPVAMLMLFAPTELEGNALAIYMGAGLLLYATGYTIFNVPYLAMPAEMTPDPYQRSKLMSFRVAMISLGTLAGTALAPYLLTLWGSAQTAYTKTSWVMTGLIVVSMAYCFLATAGAKQTVQSQTAIGAAEQWRTALANRPFRLLILSKLCQLFGVASAISSLLFLSTIVLKLPESALGVFGLTTTAATIAAMPVWLKVSKRLGKRNTYFAGVAVFAPTQLSWLLSGPDEAQAIFLLRAAVLGIGTGGIILMAQSMLPDTIEHDYQLSGLRREGVFAAVYSFVEKTAFAFGPLIIGLLLSQLGFDRALGQDQSEGAMLAIKIGAAYMPALASIASALALLGYQLQENRDAN